MIGTTVGHYRILEKLGEGGMGIVYKAEDTKLKRDVALKFLPPELTSDSEARARFIREAQTASSLDHPNIGVIHEIDEASDGRSFICMALYEGETLKQKIQRGPLEINEAVRIAIQVAEGLQRAHEAGIIHRDIKPANLLITKEGVVKIVDFGLAKLASPGSITTSASRAGTAAYMSPEQIENAHVDSRTDLFSFGIVLYEMVTGKRPFAGDHEAALFYSIVCDEPVAPRKLRPEMPGTLNAIIEGLLQKNPERRTGSAAQLLSELKRLRDAGDISRLSLEPRSVLRFFDRSRGATAIVIIIVAALLMIIPFGWRTAVNWINSWSVPAEKRIVVLPFTCIGCDKNEIAMSDGLTETMTSKLTQFQPSTGSLWVVASSEVRSNNVKSAGEAGRILGANLVVTGSVQRTADGLRFIINLVDAGTSRQLKSLVFDESSAEMSDLQDDIVNELAELLNIRLDPRSLNLVRAGVTLKSGAYELYLQGRGYMQRYERMENLALAATVFRRAIVEDSGYALAYAGLGEAYWRMFENNRDPRWVDSAVAFCAKAAELNGGLVPVRITLGMIYAGTGRYESAIGEFNEAIKHDPFNGYAYSELGRTYSGLGDTARAETAFRTAIRISPTYWGFHNDLGGYYHSQGRNRDALVEYWKVVELTPDNYRGYNNLGAIYFYLGQWDSATSAFKKSISLRPNYTGYSNLGTLLYYRGDPAGGARAYEQALRLDDKDNMVWANLAAAYAAIGQTDKSEAAYRTALAKAEVILQLNPRDAQLVCHMAGYYVALREKARAKSLLSKALALAPDDVVLAGRAAMIYEELGDRPEALRLFARAFEKGYSPAEVENAPEMKGLRNDPRFKELVRKSGHEKD